MRLTDLEPKWITPQNWAASEPFYVGVSFMCPHCPKDAPESGANRRRRLAVSFWPPIDPSGWLPRISYPNNGGHSRSGDTFDTLTLYPSIGFDSIGHFHGFITGGEVTPA